MKGKRNLKMEQVPRAADACAATCKEIKIQLSFL